MVSEDCNCKPPVGFVKAKRVAGGAAAGAWGSARVGDVLMIPAEVAARRPSDWLVLTGAPESHAVASQEPLGPVAPVEPSEAPSDPPVKRRKWRR